MIATELFNSEHLIETVGLVGLFVIVFAESGLLLGMFFPGDSLLFTAGFLASGPSTLPEKLHLPLVPLLLGVWAAAVAGDQVGYLFGRRIGPALFSRPGSRLFKVENLERSSRFFHRHGPKAVVLARFVAVVRTLTPILAGATRMDHRRFATFNVIGATAWAFGLILLGYYLGRFGFIAENLELSILAIGILSCLPVVIEASRARRNRAGAEVPRTRP